MRDLYDVIVVGGGRPESTPWAAAAMLGCGPPWSSAS